MNPEFCRLFFALWPDQTVREAIAKEMEIQRRSIKGRWIDAFNLHMTLHFLGNIKADRIACFHQNAQALQASQFSLSIDRYGYFDRPKVLWLGCRKTPQALLDLQNSLGEHLIECDFQAERRTFNPHITLARKLDRPVGFPEMSQIKWPVDRFALIESVPIDRGVQYQVLETYPLTQSPAD